GTLRLGFLFPFVPTGLQFGNSLFQSPDLLLAIQGLGLPPTSTFLEERKQLVSRTQIRIVIRNGFHEPHLDAHKNRGRTEIVLLTKANSLHFLTRF
ncbi:MAG: hypothetical protein ABFC77_10680, partial [Thermoguttaceae bacterium]